MSAPRRVWEDPVKLWLLWVLASTVAFGVGGRLGVALSPFSDIIATGFLAVSGSLLLAGALQSMVIRRLFPDASGWVLASVATVALTGVLVFGLGIVNRDVGWVLGVFVGWIALGIFQWLVLRDHLPTARWWIVANAVGFAAAIPVVALTTWLSGTSPDGALGGTLRWLAFGGAYAVATATALVWLLRGRLEPALS